MPVKSQAPVLLRWTAGALCVGGLVLVFVNQQLNLAAMAGVEPAAQFFVNRSVRFFLNDGLAIGIIWALFYRRSYVIFALWIQLAGMLLFLAPYFVLKYWYPSYNGPFLSFLHRLILNPTLLLLLIPAFYYQARKK